MKMRRMLVTKTFLFVWSLVYAETWMPFQKIVQFDGRMCQRTEIVFSKKILKHIDLCLIECSHYTSCKSIFYVESTGNCTGCTTIYDTGNTPTLTEEDSIYYGYARCPEGWFNIKESCYYITDKMVFEDGVKACMALNAHPVIIETKEENSSLKSKLSLIPSTEQVVALTAYTDAATEGTWIVVGTSDQLTIDDWGQNEPNMGTSENCMAFYEPINFQWVDITCYDAFNMICEKEIPNYSIRYLL